MSQLNPLIGSILQSSQAQRLQSERRDDRVRRSQQARRIVAADPDPEIVQVENADELEPSGDALQGGREGSRPPTEPRDTGLGDDDPGDTPRLDIRA